MNYQQALQWLSALELGRSSSLGDDCVDNYLLPNGMWLGAWTHLPRNPLAMAWARYGLRAANGEPYEAGRPVFKRSSLPAAGWLELEFHSEDWFFKWDADDEAHTVAMVNWLKKLCAADGDVFLAEVKREPFGENEVLHF